MGVTGLLIYLILTPLLGVMAVFLERIAEARMRNRKAPSFLFVAEEWYDRWKVRPTSGGMRSAGFSLVFLLAMAVAGALYFHGAALLWVLIAWMVGSLTMLGSLLWFPTSYGFRGLPREILWTGVAAVEILALTAGFFLVTAFGAGERGTGVSTILNLGGAPVYYLFGCFLGIALFLVFFPRRSFSQEDLVVGHVGRNLAFIELGRWYESVLWYGFVFFLHFGGTVGSGLLALVVCLGVFFLSMMLRIRNRSHVAALSVQALICVLALLLPLLNLLWLLFN